MTSASRNEIDTKSTYSAWDKIDLKCAARNEIDMRSTVLE